MGSQGTNTIFGSYSDHPVLFRQNNIERMRIDSSGRLIVGASSPYSADSVTISNNGFIGLRRTDSASLEVRRDGTDGTGIAFQKTGADVGSIAVKSSGISIYLGGIAAANELDDYEEGTWTPTVIGSSSDGSANYTVRTGSYTKIGRMVFWSLYVVWNSGTGAGSLRIRSFPYVVTSESTYPSVNIGQFDGLAVPAGKYPSARMQIGGNYLVMLELPVGGGNAAGLAYDTAAALIMSGHYYVD
jgi:hypothetical protein